LNAVYRRLLKMALEELRLIEEQIGELDISNNADPVKYFLKKTSPFTPRSDLVRSVHLCIDDHGSLVIFRSVCSPTQTSLRSVLRP